MSNYYEEILGKIEEAFQKENFEDAKKMIQEELSMPYIPRDTEEKLRNYLSLLPMQDQKTTALLWTSEKLHEYLMGSSEMQLMALSALEHLNIRSYMDILEDYLASKQPRLYKSFAILAMMDQQIQSEMILEEDEYSYSFIPASILPPQESDGYLIAKEILEKRYFASNPSAFQLAEKLLLRYCCEYLPETYEEDEAEDLAERVYQDLKESLGL